MTSDAYLVSNWKQEGLYKNKDNLVCMENSSCEYFKTIHKVEHKGAGGLERQGGSVGV
jgi:hypothetical protein